MRESKWEAGRAYKTRSGNEARISEVHSGKLFGRVLIRGDWVASDWDSENGSFLGSFDGSRMNLMPPPAPRIKRALWLNVYGDDEVFASSLSRRCADQLADLGRIACVRIELDIPEGYGLDGDESPILARAE